MNQSGDDDNKSSELEPSLDEVQGMSHPKDVLGSIPHTSSLPLEWPLGVDTVGTSAQARELRPCSQEGVIVGFQLRFTED